MGWLLVAGAVIAFWGGGLAVAAILTRAGDLPDEWENPEDPAKRPSSTPPTGGSDLV